MMAPLIPGILRQIESRFVWTVLEFSRGRERFLRFH